MDKFNYVVVFISNGMVECVETFKYAFTHDEVKEFAEKYLDASGCDTYILLKESGFFTGTFNIRED